MATHHFSPTTFHNTFAAHQRVLTLAPGDVVETFAVDAAGRDAANEQIATRGNPMTGPFSIEGAKVGDAISVKIVALTPNRDSGWSSMRLAANTLDPEFVADLDWSGNDRVSWRIDADSGAVTLLEELPGLPSYSLPLAPMIGCIGVAPHGGQAISTATSGPHGGNMDYRGITVGATLYFPVFVEGALLHLGDGHAVQGAGEMAGTGVETSVGVTFEVGLLKGSEAERVNWPRGEDERFIFTLGNARPLDQATQHATTEMVRWLMQRHGLTFEGASVILGQAVEYEIGNMFDPAYTVVCKVPKAVLPKRIDSWSTVITASPERIYQALLDRDAVQAWLPPTDMTGELFEFDPREGGRYRLRLTYKSPERASAGKSGAGFDDASGRFVELVPGIRVVEAVEFASSEAAFGGTMTKTTSLTPVEGGTRVTIVMENVPSGIDPDDHRKGIESTLANLAEYLE